MSLGAFSRASRASEITSSSFPRRPYSSARFQAARFILKFHFRACWYSSMALFRLEAPGMDWSSKASR